jgi:protein-disulfide isomerase
MDRRLFIGAGALGLGFALSGAAWADPAASDAPPSSTPPAVTPLLSAEPDDMTLGSPHARVTVIEYASASCPHCAKFNNEVFPAFKAKYIDTGKVFYVFREFLTPPVELAAAAFMLARCAGKGRYFNVVDGMFRAQEDIYASHEIQAHLTKIGAANGLDEKAVSACLDDQAHVDALNARVHRYVTRDGVNATPTFLINGTKLQGEQTLAQLDVAIAAAQAKFRPTPHHRRRHP